MAVSVSKDAGVNWTRHELSTTYGRVYAMAIHPHNNNIVFAGGTCNDEMGYRKGKLLKSLDGGTNWIDVSTGLNIRYNDVFCLAFSPASSNYILVGCEKGIFSSNDGGSIWSNTNTGLSYVCSILYDPNSPTTLYAATKFNGIYLSTDNGKTWASFNQGLTTSRFLCMAIDKNNSILFAGTESSGVFRNGNSPPKVLHPLADINLNEDFGTTLIADLDTIFYDLNGDPLVYHAFSCFNKVGVQLDGKTLSLISKDNIFGSDSIVVNALDSKINVSISDQFIVHVASVNDAPVLSGIGDISFPEDGATAIDLDNYVSDVDHSSSEMTFSVEAIDASNFSNFGSAKINLAACTNNFLIDKDDLKISINPATHVASFSATVDSCGIFTAVFTATDPGGLYDTDTIKVTVSPVNDPPIISALINLAFNEDDSLSCSISHWYDSVFDPESPDSILTYQLVSGRNVVVIDRDSCYLLMAPTNWCGKDTLQLLVNDGIASATAIQIAEVKPINDAPIFVDLPDSIMFKNDLSADFNIWECVHDEESPVSELAYSFWSENDSLQINYNSSTGVATLTAPNFLGITNLLIKAMDDSNAFAQQTIVVKVENPTSVRNTIAELPKEFKLCQNFPNPFNIKTTIEYQLPHQSYIELGIFNLLGQEVKSLIKQEKNAGYFNVNWDGRDSNGRLVNSGIYVLIFKVDEMVQTRKIIVLK